MLAVPARIGAVSSVWQLLVALVERDAAVLAGTGGDVDIAGGLLGFWVGWVALEGPVVVLE